MVLIELNKKDCEELRRCFVRQAGGGAPDGWLQHSGLSCRPRNAADWCSSIPPSIARRVQAPDEGLVEAHRRFATGVYALWYPLMEPTAMRAFDVARWQRAYARFLQLELSVMPDDWGEACAAAATGFVNPPFGFEESRGRYWTGCGRCCRVSGRRHIVRWLVGE